MCKTRWVFGPNKINKKLIIYDITLEKSCSVLRFQKTTTRISWVDGEFRRTCFGSWLILSNPKSQSQGFHHNPPAKRPPSPTCQGNSGLGGGVKMLKESPVVTVQLLGVEHPNACAFFSWRFTMGQIIIIKTTAYTSWESLWTPKTYL